MASERPEAEARRQVPELDSREPGDEIAANAARDRNAAEPDAEGAGVEARVSAREQNEESARDSSPPGSDRPSQPPSEGPGPRRGRFENILPGLIRRGIEKGIEAGLHTLERSVETGRGTTDAVRGVLNEVKLPRDVANAVGRALTEAKLPRDIASAVFNQFDETKNDVLRIVAGEVRDFLEATDLASEIKAALTSLSFEIRTEVRFIPNDAGTGVKADVRARSRIKRADERRGTTRRRRRREDPSPTPDEGDEPT
jgi:hypothetical protein